MRAPITKQVDDLRTAVTSAGWELISVTHDLPWWADEQWELSSNWHPVGTRAFVTFMVDPQHDGNRRPGEAVWAVCCSTSPLAGRLDASILCEVPVRPAWKDSLAKIKEALLRLREG